MAAACPEGTFQESVEAFWSLSAYVEGRSFVMNPVVDGREYVADLQQYGYDGCVLVARQILEERNAGPR